MQELAALLAFEQTLARFVLYESPISIRYGSVGR
jgi:hypothetical protein